MRGAWGTLVTIGALIVMGVIAASMFSDYVDSHGALFTPAGQEETMAMATIVRMRRLIGHLQVQ